MQESSAAAGSRALQPPFLRVLYVLDDTRSTPTTAELVRILARLVPQRVQAAVCSIAPFGDATEDIQHENVPVVSLERAAAEGLLGVGRDILAVLGLRALVEKFEPDILHLFGRRALTVGRLAAGMTRRPFLGSVGTERVRRGFAGLVDRLARSAPGRGRLVFADQDAAAAYRSADGGGEPIEIVGHGIDARAMRSGFVTPFEVLPRGGFTVGCRIEPGSTDSLRTVLEAFRIFGAGVPEARLVLFATAAEAHLEPWVDDLELAGRVLAVAPKGDGSELIRRMDVMWIHARPKPDQGLILRSFCHGVPVVCDHDTGLAPEIREIGGALMRDARWPRQVAEATRQIFADPEMRAALSRSGRLVVERRHPMGPYVSRLRSLYAAVVAEAAKTATEPSTDCQAEPA